MKKQLKFLMLALLVLGAGSRSYAVGVFNVLGGCTKEYQHPYVCENGSTVNVNALTLTIKTEWNDVTDQNVWIWFQNPAFFPSATPFRLVFDYATLYSSGSGGNNYHGTYHLTVTQYDYSSVSPCSGTAPLNPLYTYVSQYLKNPNGTLNCSGNVPVWFERNPTNNPNVPANPSPTLLLNGISCCDPFDPNLTRSFPKAACIGLNENEQPTVTVTINATEGNAIITYGYTPYLYIFDPGTFTWSTQGLAHVSMVPMAPPSTDYLLTYDISGIIPSLTKPIGCYSYFIFFNKPFLDQNTLPAGFVPDKACDCCNGPERDFTVTLSTQEPVIVTAAPVAPDPGVNYSWTLGDGYTNQNWSGVSHVYAALGNYEICAKSSGQSISCSRKCLPVCLNDATRSGCGVSDINSHFRYTYGNGTAMSFEAVNPNYLLSTYSWDFGNGVTNTGTTVSYPSLYTQPGTYTVCLTVSSGRINCRTCTQICVGGAESGQRKTEVTGAETTESVTGPVLVFPNPTRSDLTVAIRSTMARNAQIKVSDMSGRTLFDSKVSLNEGDNNQTLSLQSYPNGIYVVEVRYGNEVFRQKVIKN